MILLIYPRFSYFSPRFAGLLNDRSCKNIGSLVVAGFSFRWLLFDFLKPIAVSRMAFLLQALDCDVLDPARWS